jgi:hypothetical protein
VSQLALILFGRVAFVVPPKLSASKLLETLSQCQIVDWNYEDSETFYTPSERDSTSEMKLEFISPKKLRGLKVEPKPARKILRLEGGQS